MLSIDHETEQEDRTVGFLHFLGTKVDEFQEIIR